MQVLFDSGPPTHVDMFTGMPLWACELNSITVYSSFCDVRFSSAPFHLDQFSDKPTIVLVGTGQMVCIRSPADANLGVSIPRSPYCPDKAFYVEVQDGVDEAFLHISDRVMGTRMRPYYGVGVLPAETYYKERAIKYVVKKLEEAEGSVRNRLLRIIRVLDKEEWVE